MWATFTRHSLIHLSDIFKNFGNFPVTNEIIFDRDHKVLKGLTRGTKNPMESLRRHLNLRNASFHWMFDKTINKNPRLGTLANQRPRYSPEVDDISDVSCYSKSIPRRVLLTDVHTSYNYTYNPYPILYYLLGRIRSTPQMLEYPVPIYLRTNIQSLQRSNEEYS